MVQKLIKEGKVQLKVYISKIKNKKMPVFYNEKRVYSRSLSVYILNALNFKGTALDLLAASGARGIRLLKETKTKKVIFNDLNPLAVKSIKQNLKLNNIDSKKYEIYNKDANEFLYSYSKGFDYIDIDPFGSYTPYIRASIKYLKNNSLLGIAEFHKAALTGTYPKKCLRQFNSWCNKRIDNEVGVRIMIKDVIFEGAKQDKALIPIYTEDLNDHYRVFFKCKKGAKKVDELLDKIDFYNGIGPIWKGNLWDTNLLKKLREISDFIKEESKIKSISYFNIHKLLKGTKGNIPKISTIIKELKNNGYEVSRTHFDPNAIKVNLNKEKLKEIIMKLI